MSFTINTKTPANYNCVHTHTEIATPEPKRSTGDVPLADGLLDFTAMLSSIQFYRTRTIILKMECMGLRSTWQGNYDTVLKDLHGKKVRLELDNDTSYYWTGYATVDALKDNGASCTITIRVEADPFKRTRATSTLNNSTVSGDKTVSVTVSKMRGYLTFTTSAANATVTYDGQTWTLPNGTSTAYGLVLPNGASSIKLHGTGQTIKVVMEEGTL